MISLTFIFSCFSQYDISYSEITCRFLKMTERNDYDTRISDALSFSNFSIESMANIAIVVSLNEMDE